MNAQSLIKEAEAKGVVFILDGKKLSIDAPSSLSSTLVQAFRDNKQSIIEHIKPIPPPVKLPLAVHAVLEQLRRTKFEKDPSPKQLAWLASKKTSREIDEYQRRTT